MAFRKIIADRTVNNRLTWSLEKHGLLTAHQCGYSEHHSATDEQVYVENAVQKSSLKESTWSQYSSIQRKDSIKSGVTTPSYMIGG